MALLDADGRLTEINSELQDWLGMPATACVRQPMLEVFTRRIPEWEVFLRAWLRRAEPFEQAKLAVTGAETKGWYSMETARSGGTVFVRLSSILPPLTELADKSYQEQIQGGPAQEQMLLRVLRAEARLQVLMAHWPGVIFTQRADLRFSFASRQIEELSGIALNAWLQQSASFWEVIHEGDQEAVRRHCQQAAENRLWTALSYRIRHAQTGHVTYVQEYRQAVWSEAGVLLGYEGVWLDITRQTLAEKRLMTAAWKEVLGVLTVGMAHDFGNLMAGIYSLSDTCAAQLVPSHPCHEWLGLIQSSSLQANHLLQRMTKLHHGKLGEQTYEDLNLLMADLEELIRKAVCRRITVTLTAAAEPLPLFVDPVECRQVVINLALNAAEAMPAGGQLSLQTSCWQTPPPQRAAYGVMPRPPVVCLTVQDTGHGIKAEQLPAIFDPFYSTKAANRGSGLGLYNSRLFVERHHGAISVDTVEGHGTTFRLWLPLSDFTETKDLPKPTAPRLRLLLVGQHRSMLETSAELLRQHGLSVTTSRSHAAVREMLDSGVSAFAGVLLLRGTDDTAADELVWWLKQRQHAPKVVVQIIGCNQDEVAEHVWRQADMVLAAEMPPQELAQRLRGVLAPVAPYE